MAIGILRRPLPFIASSGFRESFNFLLGPKSLAIPADLTGCSAIATLVQANAPGAQVLIMSTGNGLITIAGNAVTIDVGIAAALAWASSWAPADCDFRLRVIDPSADVDRYVVQSDPASSRVKVSL